jgi:hypothetical protein
MTQSDNDDDVATSRTPPSLQTRVGGAVFMHYDINDTLTRTHLTDSTLASNASRWGRFYGLPHQRNTHTSRTPPSLQTRVGGAVFMHCDNDNTDMKHRHVMTPPSLQT